MEPQEDQDTTADPALLEADDDASGPVPASRGGHSSNVPRSEDAREARLAQVVDDLGGRFNRAAGTVLIREWADAELAPLRARVAELEAERDGLWEDVKALAEQVADTRRRAERAEAALARVETLADKWESGERVVTLEWNEPIGATFARALRAALAAAGPAVADGEGATSEADAWDEGYTFGRLMQFDADWADRNPSQIHNNRASLVRNLEYAKGRNHDNPHRPASPVVEPSATDEGGLAAELRKAHAQNTERPDETKRRMPTLRPAEGGATE